LIEIFSAIIVIGALLILSWIDFKTFILPDYLTYGLIAYGLIANIFLGLDWASTESSMLGALFGFVSLYALNQMYLKIRGHHGIGMGDAKLLAGLGACLGIQSLPYILLIASASGLIGGYVWLRINQQDHIRPQFFFHSIVTLKDPTEASFLYVFNNILRTRHYGAQTTRTGRVRNELVGVIFADGEITSNLRWTQAIYDQMKANNTLKSPDPLDEDDVITSAKSAIENLMNDEFIVHTDLIGDAFIPLVNEVKNLTNNEAGIKSLLQQANDEAKAYAKKHIKGKSEEAKTAKPKAGKNAKAE
jgi:Flp pilus assembly protein protease CpaA